jgi:hypothetical protein
MARSTPGTTTLRRVARLGAAAAGPGSTPEEAGIHASAHEELKLSLADPYETAADLAPDHVAVSTLAGRGRPPAGWLQVED